MANSNATTPFPLGVYIRNPNNSDAADQALFQTQYANFVALMGTAPRFFTTFIDQSQPVANWVGNSQWLANSMSIAVGHTVTPVISLPLWSTASGTQPFDQQYRLFASGRYDGMIQGVVQAWAKEGFKNLVVRPGWEMNIEGVGYAGDSAQSQAGWVDAFKHVYTVLHQAAAAAGVDVSVLWNPSVINYSNVQAADLYPGDAFVDAIGADVYSDLHPYSDDPGTPSYHDWGTGQSLSSISQFIADPVNRMHYWTYPAATKWSNDGSGGHSQTFDSLIELAIAHKKPFAVAETGAGNSSNGTDVSDDAAFPQWLAQALDAGQAKGLTVAFVNLWDSNGAGNYQFSEVANGKPNEAAAWAKYFGAKQGVSAPDAAASSGSGDTITLHVSEDGWMGDAQFTVRIDGATIGGVRTATASHAAGDSQAVSLDGGWGAGQHTVGVSFLNDAWGGTAATDRNLYVDQLSFNGQAAGGPAMLSRNGTTDFVVGAPTRAVTLGLQLAEDAWRGDAQYQIAVDGQTLTTGQTVTASHAAGQAQAVSLTSMLSVGTHDLAVSFLNDAWAGTPAQDRNLYLLSAQADETAIQGATAVLGTTSTDHFQFVVPA